MNSNLSYSPETPNLGQIRRFLEPCDLEIWGMTLKNNREPLLSNIKLYALFYHHMWIQTGVTVQKRLSWVVTSVTLTFDLWPWSFACTLLSSLVITPENFMMIRSWEQIFLWLKSMWLVTQIKCGRTSFSVTLFFLRTERVYVTIGYVWLARHYDCTIDQIMWLTKLCD